MDTNDKKYFDDAFKLIQLRLTNLETQITLLFNVEKKRMAEAQGKPLQQVEEEIKSITLEVHDDLTHLAAKLKGHIES